MDRLFLDANVLFSAAYLPSSKFRTLWNLTNVDLITSDFAKQEAEFNLTKKRPRQMPDLVALLLSVAIVSPASAAMSIPPGLLLPLKDEVLFLAAQQASATHFLTGDLRHFGPYFGQKFGGILIQRPAEYLKGQSSNP